MASALMRHAAFYIAVLSVISIASISAQIPTPSEPPARNYSGRFLVVAPKTIRPGLPYAVSINILDTRHPENIVRVQIRDKQNQTLAGVFETNIVPGEPRTATIEPQSSSVLVEGGQYTLFVSWENLGGTLLFQEQRALQYDKKSLSIFVQTDKAIYKPGALVKFRVLVVKPDLKPYGENLDVKIQDYNQNVIAQHMDKSLEKGVYSNELQLSDEPPLGDWKIEVQTTDGYKFTKTFSVEKYVLPKFEVIVEPPTVVTSKDDIPIVVKAKYTYGKGVDGTVKVHVTHPWSLPSKDQAPLETTMDLDENGEAIVRFSNEELIARDLVTEYGYNRLRFLATVTEGLTGIQRNGTAAVMTTRVDTKVKITKPANNFKPGLNFTFMVAVVLQDDTPIPDSYSRQCRFKVTYHYPTLPDSTEVDQEEGAILEDITLGPDGTKEMTISPPATAKSFRMEVSYDPKGKIPERPEITTSEYISAAKSPTKNYLQLVAEQGSVEAGQTVSFNIRLTKPVQYITWQVVSRGSVVKTATQEMTGTTGMVSFETNSQMSPKSKLVVYSVLADSKEIVVDATDFRVDGLFRNKVSVRMNLDRAEPGDEVEVEVRADPDSFVGLLAIDQSVLLLKSGNDISPDLVEQDIEQYDTSGFSGGPFRPWEGPLIMERRRRKRSTWFPWWGIGGKDAESLFQNAGLIVLTDAWLYSEPSPPIMWKSGIMEAGVEMDGAPQPIAVNSPGGVRKTASPAAPRVRKEFPETWLWVDAVASPTGKYVHKAMAPDTITSWIASAFAVNDQSGLGVADSTAKLEVFRPFFIRLNLPYSVKRGEKLGLQVLVFNYMPQEQSVLVTLKPNGGFEFVDKNGKQPNKATKFNERKVKVPGGGGSRSIFFPIIPKKIGDVKLELVAMSGSARDAVQQVLKVEAEGFQVDKNIPVVLDLTESAGEPVKKSISLDFPPEAIEGSQRAKFAVIGDVMGPVLANIENLVRMPYGCGEQNMLNFVPNIVVMRYLEAIERTEPALKAKATKYMESGYQRELNYKRTDGSFSAFGESDSQGSTWLTAFVVRAFHQAKEFIHVDEEILSKAIAFLKGRQNENGEYVERGEVHHKDMQGGSGQGGVPLTAYVLVAMLQNGQNDPEALNYIESNLEQIRSSPYSLAVAAYALHLADSAQKDEAFQMLEELAQEKDGGKYWSDKVGEEPEKDEERPWYWSGPKPVDVEMTAYGLLTYMQREDANGAVPLIKWLTNQRNAYGGFSSTQDTVMALQALGAYAEVAYSPDFNVDITVRNGDSKNPIAVRPDNSIVLQNLKLTNLADTVEIEATGSGSVFAQVSWSYNVKKLPTQAPFSCDPSVNQTNADNLLVSMCCKYTKSGKSNMAVLEMDSLSGYEIDEEALLKLTDIKDLQRVEVMKGQTKANIYFNSLGSSPVCFNILNQRTFPVAEQKPAFAVLYDYYLPSDRADMEYSSRQKRSLSESCPDCWNFIPSADEPTGEEQEGTDPSGTEMIEEPDDEEPELETPSPPQESAEEGTVSSGPPISAEEGESQEEEQEAVTVTPEQETTIPEESTEDLSATDEATEVTVTPSEEDPFLEADTEPVTETEETEEPEDIPSEPEQDQEELDDSEETDSESADPESQGGLEAASTPIPESQEEASEEEPKKCEDIRTNCDEYCPSKRTDRSFIKWIKYYCPKTCGYCSSGKSRREPSLSEIIGSTTATPTVPESGSQKLTTIDPISSTIEDDRSSSENSTIDVPSKKEDELDAVFLF